VFETEDGRLGDGSGRAWRPLLCWENRAEEAAMSLRRKRNDPLLSERRIAGDDRRNAPRYTTHGTPAVLAWAEGDQHRATPATLIDISMGGLSAWVEDFPPRGVPVWLRLDSAKPSPWLKACVVATSNSSRLFRTRRHVRLRFLEACTYDMFKQAIDGFTREQDLGDRYEGFDGRYWR
jgi:hypothetical protein